MRNLDLVFDIPGVFCLTCTNAIETALTSSQYRSLIQSITFDLNQKNLQLNISFDEALSDDDIITNLINAVRPTGFHMTYCDPHLHEDKKDNTHVIGAILGLSLGLIWILASLGLFSFALMSTWPFILVNNALLMYVAAPFVRKAWNSLMAGIQKDATISPLVMDSLFAMTGFMIVASSILSLFFPIFVSPLEAGFLIFGFRHLGCIVQGFLDKKMGMRASFTRQFEDTMYQLAEGGDIAAKDLQPGYTIILHPGQVLAVDATVLASTNAKIKNTLYDGGRIPSEDIPQQLKAGVELSEGTLTLKVLSNLDNSYLGQLDEELRRIILAQQSKLLTQVERGLQWFIPIILAIALISGVVVAYFFSVALAIQCVTAVLVSACPCTLGLIIPMASRLGAYQAAQKGVIFQSAQALEDAGQVDTFVLDYNGTLTTGTPSFEDFKVHATESSISTEDCLAAIYRIEQEVLEKRNDDRWAQAIIDGLKKKKSEPKTGDVIIDEAQHIHQLTTKEGTYLFGNNNLLLKCQPTMQEHIKSQALHLLWKNSDGVIRYLGHLQEKDSLRQNAKTFVEQLCEKGQVSICTGADEMTADEIRRQFGDKIQVSYNQRFKDKSNYIRSLKEKEHKRVVMIGDAINDIAALHESHLGVLFKNNAISQHWADEELKKNVDMSVNSDNLMDILYGLNIAKQTSQVIYQNLIFSLIYNLLSVGLACGLLLSFGIALPPALGVVLMILQSVCLAFNTWRGIAQPDADAGFSLNALAAT